MSRSAGTGAGAPEASPSRRPESRPLLLGTAHLTGLCAFAISQPLFDLLAKGPEFFATRGSTGLDILLFALAVTLGPPALMLVAELVAWLVHPRLRVALHSVFIAGLVALIALQLLKKAGADGVATVAVLVCVLAGAGVAYGYWRGRGIRAFLTVLAPASLLFLVLFLVFSPVSELTTTPEAHARGDVIRSRTPVVMVVFDEFPTTSLMDERHGVDELRYPGFAALARDATWYRNATGVHDSTAQAVPAILDAKYPVKGRLPVPSGHPDNVFTLFGEGGYRMNVNEDVTKLCTRRLCLDQRTTPFGQRMRSLASDLSLVYFNLVLPEELERKLL